MKITIFGLGLIGGSLAKAIKHSFPTYHILGMDKPEIISKALSEKIINESISSCIQAKDSDIIFLALPTEFSLEKLQILAPIVKKDAIITDVSGVKKVFEEKWQSIQSEGIFVGGHPMTGKEASGYENSDPILFENAVYILTEDGTEREKIIPLINLLEKIGARIKFIDSDTHDKIVANVSHLPQLIAVSLVNSILQNDDNNFLDFAAGGFRDMTRIASSDFSIWRNIIRFNKHEILDALYNFQNDLHQTITKIVSDDYWGLEELFENAKIKRDEIPKNVKGFLNPLHDIFVYVKDEPGVLYKLISTLYNNGIDIKDIELLKIREGTGGTFRLSFETEEIAEQAKALFENIGFHTR